MTKTEKINALRAALGELELAVIDLDVVELVRGWGEPRHRPELGVKLPVNAGKVYRLTDALSEATRLMNSAEHQ